MKKYTETFWVRHNQYPLVNDMQWIVFVFPLEKVTGSVAIGVLQAGSASLNSVEVHAFGEGLKSGSLQEGE